MRRIDLRSDTVTRPTAAMRRAMAAADVGDDVYGEDPTVRRLEELVAGLLGKETAVFVPSGTMGNQIALKLLTRPGDEVIAGEGAHCAFYEAGAAAALSGVQVVIAGSGGLFNARDLDAAIKPDKYYYPRTSVVAIENTHNRAGGRVFPQQEVEAISGRARALGLGLHLDGARLWNAEVASGLPLRVLAAPFDTVSVCLSKGLGAPAGTLLALGRDGLDDARRLRRMLGGAMRQSGVLAAAGLHAVEHHRSRLHDDHEAARAFARIVGTTSGASIAPEPVETNIVNVVLANADARTVERTAAERGVLVLSTAPNVLRAVTHLDATRQDVEKAASVLAEIIERTPRAVG